ncbi:excinuclease ABC subunit A [Weissella diestrammenae]|uniref:Excinuclease ABC subunit A n=1 Tax=Weissella diestrammenae TaxID=1162633 RepID=A0A7G9T5N1_9LACO|nr:excinuclease ABC subunit A [Weissella diestrammenae]MCM0582232.1 excinuclease ABC subunit A [Weissella diestrammenae]QNN75406.1 excinuclease ABC subunit A [Weissella diestrammenae]
MKAEEVTAKEPRRKIMLIDSKSFYASVESVDLGLNPLKSILVVMSQQENTNGGLVLAASPRAKKELGVRNVMRQRDVPKDPRLIIVNPRMNRYIAVNKQVNNIYRQFVSEEDLHLYSIDESILDITPTWEYLRQQYGKDLTMKKLARTIQLKMKKELGLYLTVGIGDSVAMAKMALDIEAKHAHSLIGEWHYETIPEKLWPVSDFSEVWSIGRQTAKKLKQYGITNMYDLAMYDPYRLIDKLGVRGAELSALAWGVDRSIVSHRYEVKEGNISNSQVLPRDYYQSIEVKNVIREIGEQISSRLRAKNKQAGVISLQIGFSYASSENAHQGGFSAQLSIEHTDKSKPIVAALWRIFDEHYAGQAIRHIGVSAGKLIDAGAEQMDLFVAPKVLEEESNIEKTIDAIRAKFGVTSIVKSSSMIEGGTMINRVGLVGGHNGGNAYGR